MAKKFNNSDPTANQAIGNATRQNSSRDRPKGRRLLDEFPDLFAGLLPHEAREVALRAHHLAGNDVRAIEQHHLEQARNAVRKAAS